MLSRIFTFLTSLILPSLYVTGLTLTFTLFKQWNNHRLQNKSKSHTASPYFPRHISRDVYLELSEQYSPENDEGRGILATALLKRAVQDVRRIIKVREEKGPLAALVRSGSVGEELLENIQAAEDELNEECEEVATESEMIKPGWKTTIFQEASQIATLEMQKEKAAASSLAVSSTTTRPTKSSSRRASEEPAMAPEVKEVKDEVIDDKRRLELEEELVRGEEKERQREKQKASQSKKAGKKGGKK